MDAGEARPGDLVFVTDIVDSAIAGMRPLAEKDGMDGFYAAVLVKE